MVQRKYKPEYITKAKELVSEILNDKKEFDDYTQISISIQDAVQAAANTFGCSSDEEVDKIRHFIQEVAYSAVKNIQSFDIVFKKKGK